MDPVGMFQEMNMSFVYIVDIVLLHSMEPHQI